MFKDLCKEARHYFDNSSTRNSWYQMKIERVNKFYVLINLENVTMFWGKALITKDKRDGPPTANTSQSHNKKRKLAKGNRSRRNYSVSQKGQKQTIPKEEPAHDGKSDEDTDSEEDEDKEEEEEEESNVDKNDKELVSKSNSMYD